MRDFLFCVYKAYTWRKKNIAAFFNVAPMWLHSKNMLAFIFRDRNQKRGDVGYQQPSKEGADGKVHRLSLHKVGR